MNPAAIESTTSGDAVNRPWWIGPALLLIVVLYVFPLAGSPPSTNPNEVVRLELAASLAYLGQLDLGETAAVYGLSEDVSIRDGKVYSDKAPGLSFASVPLLWVMRPVLGHAPSSELPAYWPLRHALTGLLIALPTIGLAILVGATLSSSTSTRTTYLLIAALATPLWTYGTVFFGHAPAALLVFVAWYLLLGFPQRQAKLTLTRAVGGGVAAGFAVATEYPTAILIAIIYLTLVVRRNAIPVVAGAVAGAVVGVFPALLYHHLAFGAPWITGYSFKAANDFQAIIGHGVFGISWPSFDALWGICCSARRGIFFYCPLLVLTPFGLWSVARKRGLRDVGPAVVATIAYILFAAGFVDWTAGWCAAARHLVPVLPIMLVFALSATTELVENRWGSMIVVALVAASGLNAVLTIALTPFFPPEFGSPLAQLVLPSLADGAGFSNVASSVSGVSQAVVAVLVGAAALVVLTRALGNLQPEGGWRCPAISLTTVALLLLVYSWQGSAPPSESEMVRSQMLRRLGHEVAADRLEEALSGETAP